MTVQTVDKRVTLDAQSALIEVRGASGRLYGMFDPQRMVIEFKKGEQIERIDLRPYLEAVKTR